MGKRGEIIVRRQYQRDDAACARAIRLLLKLAAGEEAKASETRFSLADRLLLERDRGAR